MTPTKFNISLSTVREEKTNTSYPYRIEISNADGLKKVAKYDHTGGLFSDFTRKTGETIKTHRSLTTFLKSNCDIFDCDNEAENLFNPDIPPEKWKTPTDIDALFPNVESYTVYSRNHMKEKDGKAARPKFHKYYPRRTPLKDDKEVSEYNQAVRRYCPAFDKQALDAARFIYGVENPIVEYVPGKLTLDEFMKQRQTEQKQPQQIENTEKEKIGAVIPVGHRNNTLSSTAFSLLKKYGADNGKTLEIFLQTATKCNPLLNDSEVKTIWNSALKGYAEKILTDPAYISPSEYAKQEIDANIEPSDYTDVGQAQLFFVQYNKCVRYSAATKWLVYNGKKWEESEIKAHGLAQKLTDRQLIEVRKRLKKPVLLWTRRLKQAARNFRKKPITRNRLQRISERMC